MSVTFVSDCSDSSINYNDVADCHIQIRGSATQFESNDHSKVDSLLYVHMHCHLPSSSRFADALLAGSMTGNVDSCTEHRDDRPRWMVHFLLRRIMEGDYQATTTVFSISSEYRHEDETAHQCVQRTLKEERASGWQICTLWVGFFSVRDAFNKRRRMR